jgi:hypothetical protein
MNEFTVIGHAVTKIPGMMGRSYPGLYRVEILTTPAHHLSEYQWNVLTPEGVLEEELSSYVNVRFSHIACHQSPAGWPQWGEFLMWAGEGLVENHGPENRKK